MLMSRHITVLKMMHRRKILSENVFCNIYAMQHLKLQIFKMTQPMKKKNNWILCMKVCDAHLNWHILLLIYPMFQLVCTGQAMAGTTLCMIYMWKWAPLSKHDGVIKWKYFPSQRPVMRSFEVFFDLHLNKWLNKHSVIWNTMALIMTSL